MHQLARNNGPSSKAGSMLSSLPTEDLNRAVTDFKRDGISGRHQEFWAQEALQACQSRCKGEFEEFLTEISVTRWGQYSEQNSGESERPQAELTVPDRTNHDLSPGTNSEKADKSSCCFVNVDS